MAGWFIMAPDTVRALRVVHGVHAGAELSAGDFEAVEVPADTEGVVAADELSKVLRRVGGTARNDLPAGTLLSLEHLSAQKGLPKPGQTLVGVALEPGQLPAGGLAVGDVVGAVTSITSGSGAITPEVLISKAPVWAVREQGGTVQVSLLVEEERASTLAAYAASNPVSLVRLGHSR